MELPTAGPSTGVITSSAAVSAASTREESGRDLMSSGERGVVTLSRCELSQVARAVTLGSAAPAIYAMEPWLRKLTSLAVPASVTVLVEAPGWNTIRLLPARM